MDREIKSIATQVETIWNTRPQKEIASTLICQKFLCVSIIKRILDIVLSSIGLVLLSPLFVLIVISIKLNDGGSAFYFCEFVELHGRRFYAIKFRTIIMNAASYLYSYPKLLEDSSKI